MVKVNGLEEELGICLFRFLTNNMGGQHFMYKVELDNLKDGITNIVRYKNDYINMSTSYCKRNYKVILKNKLIIGITKQK